MLRQLWLNKQSNNVSTYRTDMFSLLCAFSDYDHVIAIAEPKHELKDNKASGGRLRCWGSIMLSVYKASWSPDGQIQQAIFLWIRSPMVERPTVNREVAGSSPAVSAYNMQI